MSLHPDVRRASWHYEPGTPEPYVIEARDDFGRVVQTWTRTTRKAADGLVGSILRHVDGRATQQAVPSPSPAPQETNDGR